MAELRGAKGTLLPIVSCCAAEKQAHCCAPDEKARCCLPGVAGCGCGCQPDGKA